MAELPGGAMGEGAAESCESGLRVVAGESNLDGRGANVSAIFSIFPCA